MLWDCDYHVEDPEATEYVDLENKGNTKEHNVIKYCRYCKTKMSEKRMKHSYLKEMQGYCMCGHKS